MASPFGLKRALQHARSTGGSNPTSAKPNQIPPVRPTGPTAESLPPSRETPYPSAGELTGGFDPGLLLDLLFDFRFPGWPIRNQGTPDNCVAFSAIACFEHYLYGKAGENKPAYSAQFLIYAIKTGTDDPHKDLGYTYLRWAYEALRKDGACHEALYPYTGQIVGMVAPTEAVRNEAKRFAGNVFYRDLLLNKGDMHAAALVYECLRQNERPVAISLPTFPESGPGDLTNWTNHNAFHHGAVSDVGPDVARVGQHCVCVTGFIPSATEGNGGYFVFRNSWGTAWAGFAPSTLPGPTGPQPGYGVLSATYVNQHCKEILQLY